MLPRRPAARLTSFPHQMGPPPLRISCSTSPPTPVHLLTEDFQLNGGRTRHSRPSPLPSGTDRPASAAHRARQLHRLRAPEPALCRQLARLPSAARSAGSSPNQSATMASYFEDLNILTRRDGIVVQSQSSRATPPAGSRRASNSDRREAEEGVHRLQALYRHSVTLSCLKLSFRRDRRPLSPQSYVALFAASPLRR